MMNPISRSLDDGMQAPLEPQALMPAQFFTQRERRNAHSSVQRLMCAILEDAVSEYTRHAGGLRRTRTFHETRRWLFSSDRKWVFSFLRICEALDLDPEAIRREVLMGCPRQAHPARDRAA